MGRVQGKVPDARKAVGAGQAFYISQFASNPGVEPQPCSAFALGGGTFLPLLQCVPSSALLSGRQRPSAEIQGEVRLIFAFAFLIQVL